MMAAEEESEEEEEEDEIPIPTRKAASRWETAYHWNILIDILKQMKTSAASLLQGLLITGDQNQNAMPIADAEFDKSVMALVL